MGPGVSDPHLPRADRILEASAPVVRCARVLFLLSRHDCVWAPVVPERSMLFPCLKLEPSLRFGLWPEVFASVKGGGISFRRRTDSWRARYSASRRADEVVGIGIDAPAQQSYPRHQQDPADDCPKHDPDQKEEPNETSEPTPYLPAVECPFDAGIDSTDSFVFYGGRVLPTTAAKRCSITSTHAPPRTATTRSVLTGPELMKYPRRAVSQDGGRAPGTRADDRLRSRRRHACARAGRPGRDHLSRASRVGTPVLASARNEAAVDYCRRAERRPLLCQPGRVHRALRLLTTDARLRGRLGENGRRFVRQHQRWDAVLGRFERLMMRVRKS